MKKIKSPKFALVSVLLASVSLSHAATIVSYEFENTGSTNDPESVNATPFQATTFDVNVTASTFGGSGGSLNPLSLFGLDSIQAAEGQGMEDGTTNDMAGAIAANQFLGFTVTANTGFTLDLDNLIFDVSRGTRGTLDYAVRSSVDSFATDIVFEDDVITTTSTPQTISLAGAIYDNLSSVTFRIYFDDRVNNNTSASATFIDNVFLNGTVVPEPSSYAMLGGALALCVVMLRRRRA